MKTEKSLSFLEAESLMENEQVLIFDLRKPMLFRCGHIPNAINLQPAECDSLLAEMNKEVSFLFYGEDSETAQAVASLFYEFGFEKSHFLEGGYDEWERYKLCSAKLTPVLCQWLSDNGYHDCHVDQRGFNGETPLMTAAKKGVPAIMIELIDHGADIDAVNHDGNSAVWLACYSKNIYALTLLIQEGADLNISNDNGVTPLIYAASAGRSEMVQLLLDSGADFYKESLDGFSALDVASTLKVMKMLRRYEKGKWDVKPEYALLEKAC